MAVVCTFGVTKVCTDNSSAMPTAKTANGGFPSVRNDEAASAEATTAATAGTVRNIGRMPTRPTSRALRRVDAPIDAAIAPKINGNCALRP